MNERQKERVEAIRHTVHMSTCSIDKNILLKTALERDIGAGNAAIVVNEAIKHLTEKAAAEALTPHQREHLVALCKHKKAAMTGDRSAQEFYTHERAWLLQSGVKIPNDLTPFEQK